MNNKELHDAILALPNTANGDIEYNCWDTCLQAAAALVLAHQSEGVAVSGDTSRVIDRFPVCYPWGDTTAELVRDGESRNWILRKGGSDVRHLNKYENNFVNSAIAAAPQPTAAVDERVADYKHIAYLIGSIYMAGGFVAETEAERELETLLVKTGHRYKTWNESEAGFAALSTTTKEQT